MKTKGHLDPKLNPMAFCASSCGPVAQWIPSKVAGCVNSLGERHPAKVRVAGSSPARFTRLISPTDSVNYLWGFASGRSLKQGCDTHCHCAFGLTKGQGQNGLPQLPNGNGEGGILWKESGSAVEMPTMREAVL
jgi:hypothetical protein